MDDKKRKAEGWCSGGGGERGPNNKQMKDKLKIRFNN